MRKILAFFLILIFFMFALPAGITVLSKYKNADNREIYEEGDAVTTGSFNDDLKISVYAKSEDKLMEIRLEDYLVGVLAGEMPPTYEREALKAQAIAARSYILGRVSEYLEGNIHESHNGAMVCTDYEHCKAWRDINEIRLSVFAISIVYSDRETTNGSSRTCMTKFGITRESAH